jgi:hypothetical protein
MAPDVTDRWAVIDTQAEIRAGDLFSFSTRDYRTAFAARPGCSGAVKRFHGINHELGFIECSRTNPPMTIHTGLTNLTHAHRVVATTPDLRSAHRLTFRGGTHA